MPHVVRNFELLATTPLREDALTIAEAGYAAVNIRGALTRKLRIEYDKLCIGDARYSLSGRRVFFVGVGKCAIAAAETMETLLGERLTRGIALDVATPDTLTLTKTETYVGTHPLPSDINERATERITEFLTGLSEEDLVIILISGGGSALLCLHDAPMTCLDEGLLFKSLTEKGVGIAELNTVRKHLSRARGGGLAKAAYPAEVVALIVSDVPDNNIEFIASGPTVRNEGTVADAEKILTRTGVGLPPGVSLIETPKEARYFERVSNILFLTNEDALTAMKASAESRGYTVTVVDRHYKGEAQKIGSTIAERFHGSPSMSAYLYGGESTVTVGSQKGVGGRNQELALAALGDVHDDTLVLPFSSDGRDNSDHAGGVADATTLAHAREKSLDRERALLEHDSYTFFAACGDFLDTGNLESNVSDLIIALKK